MKEKIILISFFLFLVIFSIGWSFLESKLFSSITCITLLVIGLLGLFVTYIVFYKTCIKNK